MPSMTTVVAVYAGALSTVTAAIGLWDRRRRVIVTLNYRRVGPEDDDLVGVAVEVRNPGHGPVWVEHLAFSLEKKGWSGVTLQDRRWPQGFPLELPPGARVAGYADWHQITSWREDTNELFDAGIPAGEVDVFGVCVDGMGKTHYSKAIKFDPDAPRK